MSKIKRCADCDFPLGPLADAILRDAGYCDGCFHSRRGYQAEIARITAINTDLRQQLAVAKAERDEARATDQNARTAYMKMIVITKELQSEIVDLEHELAMSKAEVERLTLSNETEKFSTDSHKIDFSPSTPQAPRF